MILCSILNLTGMLSSEGVLVMIQAAAGEGQRWLMLCGWKYADQCDIEVVVSYRL